ncbi:MAG: phosphatidate cytidylyltransferase [Calditrichaeota bacterium]|nr:MAG: phosphatidate cytidylyltransferase [Calditrichota bacterium]
MSDLGKRVGVALWGIPLVVIATYLGGPYFLALILAINGVALREFYQMFTRLDVQPFQVTGIVLGSLLVVLTYGNSAVLLDFYLLAVVVILLQQLMPGEGKASLNGALTIAGLSYVSLFLAMLLRLRMHFAQWTASEGITHAGGRFLLVVLASIWICDTAAYFGGRRFGRHRLAPVVSPKKTVEGALFGLVFALGTCWLGGRWALPQLPDRDLVATGLVVGLMGQLGDLVESRFKRDTGVKDTSSILPGHGGILDRFDSLLFVSPFLYAWFLYF